LKKHILLLVLTVLAVSAFARSKGPGVFSFLDLTYNARASALGGTSIAIRDQDISLATTNPSLLNPTMKNQLALSIVDYFAGITYGQMVYGGKIGKSAAWSTGINYVNYGRFDETTAAGDFTGAQFHASDYAMHIAFAKPLNTLSGLSLPVRFDSLFHVGVNSKFIYSQLADYTASGLALDAAITYYNSKAQRTVTLLARNAGLQLKAFTPGVHEALPFQVQLGYAQKLKKAPLRILATWQHVEHFKLLTDSISTGLIGTAADQVSGPSMFDQALAHVAIGTEILLSKNFNIRFGYNLQRRKELGVDTRMSITGLSFGLGFRVSKFQFSYGRAAYHLAGPSNTFSVSMNLQELMHRK